MNQNPQDSMLARIDERTSNMTGTIKDVKDDVATLRRELGEKFQEADSRYVSKAEFQTVRNIVYGQVGIILTGVAVAVLSLVVNK